MYRQPSAVPNQVLDIFCVALTSHKYESDCCKYLKEMLNLQDLRKVFF